MPRICYQEKNFRPSSLKVIAQANKIIAEYARQGFDLTLRQLYYQFVARALIPNKQSEYKKLGSVVNDARLAGFIDWNAIVDRTRRIRSLDNWTDPADIVHDCVNWYQLDKWSNQPTRIEVWIEKDALVGVIEGVCQRNDVSFFSCRGYSSQSSMWRAAQRIRKYIQNDEHDVLILHLGDHDPSGIDMSRDIKNRLELFLSGHGIDESEWEVRRIALNMDQVRAYNPPPNPAKTTDSRAADYIAEHGYESWELDALDPATLAGLIEEHIRDVRDDGAWAARCKEEELGRFKLQEIAEELEEDR